MQKYLREKAINRITDFIHPTLGALSQNASERVGMVALRYRRGSGEGRKDTDLKATHYKASTSLAISHVNNVVITNFRRMLEQKGFAPDERIERFDTFEHRLYELDIEVSPTEAQVQDWRADAVICSRQSDKLLNTN